MRIQAYRIRKAVVVRRLDDPESFWGVYIGTVRHVKRLVRQEMIDDKWPDSIPTVDHYFSFEVV